VNGDGKADVCGRGAKGVVCALSNGGSFGGVSVWESSFSDANGWAAAQYYSTIQFPDINGDGKADVCGRGAKGVVCALSNGGSFGGVSVWQSSFSDANGWAAAQYYSTIQFPDVNGDGKADVCGRGAKGVVCALSNGGSFGGVSVWESSFSDANGWAAAQYYSTIQFSDIDGDGNKDLCGRGVAGIQCALSTGGSFGLVTVWESSFSDANGWAAPHCYSTIRIVGGVICGRGAAGIYCAFSNSKDRFANLGLESSNESDANGWNQPQYYKTIQLTRDFKLAERGSVGIQSGPLFPPDQVSISSVADLNARRAALIKKLWNRTTVDTVEGVDEDAPPEIIDVQPLPPGVTVRRYKINMPTSGGSPIPGGPAVVQGIADHFIPSGGSQKLVILNPGHACRYTSLPYQDSEAVIELLNAGYAVLATYMPLQTPLHCFGFGGSHNDLFDPTKNLRPANGAHPLIYFLDPVRRSLNYVISRYGYTQIHMAGLSGGGWTTTLYAALDTRIKTSVPIAGTEPFYMRIQSDAEQEDQPEIGSDFFRFSSGDGQVVTGYKDLYLLGSYGAGRRQIQALNRNDDCCFGQNHYKGSPAQWDRAVRAYELEVRQRLQTLGAGSFRVEINEADDPGSATHSFSKNTRIAVLITELDGAASLLGATSGFFPFGRGMNGRLWRSNGPEAGWTDTGLAMVGTPAIVTGAISGHTFDVFYRDPFNRLTHAFFDGASWTPTNNLSGRIISDPVAVSWGAGRIDVVAIGHDYRLYHWKYDGAWHPAELVHSSARGVGSLAVTSWGPNRLDIFFRGHDAGLYHIQSNGEPPFTLTNTGRVIKGFPSALATSDSLWVFATGVDDQLLQGQQVNSGDWIWTNVSSLSGSTSINALGSPSASRLSNSSGKVCARILGGQPDQVGCYAFSIPKWDFSNQEGATPLGSPVATDLGVFIVDANDQSVWLLTSHGWRSLGGSIDR
jgi:hypothetical protein